MSVGFLLQSLRKADLRTASLRTKTTKGATPGRCPEVTYLARRSLYLPTMPPPVVIDSQAGSLPALAIH